MRRPPVGLRSQPLRSGGIPRGNEGHGGHRSHHHPGRRARVASNQALCNVACESSDAARGGGRAGAAVRGGRAPTQIRRRGFISDMLPGRRAREAPQLVVSRTVVLRILRLVPFRKFTGTFILTLWLCVGHYGRCRPPHGQGSWRGDPWQYQQHRPKASPVPALFTHLLGVSGAPTGTVGGTAVGRRSMRISSFGTPFRVAHAVLRRRHWHHHPLTAGMRGMRAPWHAPSLERCW